MIDESNEQLKNRWQVIKDHMPIQICNTIEEAEKVYQEYDADEIRRVE